MLISRCAWHQRYYRRPSWRRVVSWRGFTLRFTDGICPRCLAHVRAEHRRLLEVRGAEHAGHAA